MSILMQHGGANLEMEKTMGVLLEHPYSCKRIERIVE